MDIMGMLPIIKLVVSSSLTYYVYKDATKNKIPYRNAWLIFTFVFFPVFFGYLYYAKSYYPKQNKKSSLYYREMEMRQRHHEQQLKIKAECEAWEKARQEEMALNKITEEELEKAKQKRAEEKAQRLKELEEERKLQEEAIAKQMHIKK